MPRLPRSLASGAVIALTLAAATVCGEDSNADAPSVPGPRSVELADLDFVGDEPLAWPHVDVCDESVMVSANSLSGQGDSAVFDPATGKGSTIEVDLPGDSTLEPDATWQTSLACVSGGDDGVTLARYGPLMDRDGASVWAGFDTEGNQLWVREFEDYTTEYVADGLVAFKTGSLDGESVDWTLLDPVSGEEAAALEQEPLDSLTPVSSDRYVTDDGLVDLAGEVVNEDVSSYEATSFGQGTGVLAGGLDLTAYDPETGDELWTSKVPDPFSDPAYDDQTGTLVWRSSEDVVYGVAAKTGDKLWAYQLPAGLEASMSDVFAAGSGIVVVGTPTLGRPIVLDVRTGEPIDLSDATTVLSAGPAGVAVVEDGALEVVDGADLS